MSNLGFYLSSSAADLEIDCKEEVASEDPSVSDKNRLTRRQFDTIPSSKSNETNNRILESRLQTQHNHGPPQTSGNHIYPSIDQADTLQWINLNSQALQHAYFFDHSPSPLTVEEGEQLSTNTTSSTTDSQDIQVRGELNPIARRNDYFNYRQAPPSPASASLSIPQPPPPSIRQDSLGINYFQFLPSQNLPPPSSQGLQMPLTSHPSHPIQQSSQGIPYYVYQQRQALSSSSFSAEVSDSARSPIEHFQQLPPTPLASLSSVSSANTKSGSPLFHLNSSLQPLTTNVNATAVISSSNSALSPLSQMSISSPPPTTSYAESRAAPAATRASQLPQQSPLIESAALAAIVDQPRPRRRLRNKASTSSLKKRSKASSPSYLLDKRLPDDNGFVNYDYKDGKIIMSAVAPSGNGRRKEKRAQAEAAASVVAPSSGAPSRGITKKQSTTRLVKRD